MLDGEECGRRVGKLYRPPEGRYFVYRLCLDLTYESCQKALADAVGRLRSDFRRDRRLLGQGLGVAGCLLSDERGQLKARVRLGSPGGNDPRTPQGPGVGPLIDLRHEALGLAWRPHVVGVVLALRQLERWLRLVLVGDAGEQMGDGVQSRSPLVVRLDDPPGG